ncbi:hypothetical protein EVAR_53818_1 [Eumeta japonica]|uniref:Uncharacterized protein n=1 Tax=Eumeta variegata TaxID=151549 RepID=A0A4C1YL52_EUMVA|nr:hypothetical protein EVAR_53818_1 [Eumeta japonica]
MSRKDRCRNSDVRERCGLKEDVVTRVERVTNKGTTAQPTKPRVKRVKCIDTSPTLKYESAVSMKFYMRIVVGA